MKLLLYIVILVAVLLLPFQGTDVGKLIPVEAIAISQAESLITVETDTGDRGEGTTLAQALENLKDTAPGIIYLDTAEYLLVEQTKWITEMKSHLKGSVKMYGWEQEGELKGIADFLSVHQSGIRLKEWTENIKLPQVRMKNDRWTISEE